MALTAEALISRVQVNIPFPFLGEGYLDLFLDRGLNPGNQSLRRQSHENGISVRVLAQFHEQAVGGLGMDKGHERAVGSFPGLFIDEAHACGF